jgi:hypothetical protein
MTVPGESGRTEPGSIRPTRRGAGQRSPATLLMVCLLLVGLMLLLPSVAASPLGPVPKPLTAPFSGTPLVLRDTISEDCASATLSHGPAFNLGSGVGRVQANATANSSTSCSSPFIGNAGLASGWFGLSTPNLTHISGSHKTYVTWDIHGTIDLKASGAGSTPANVQTGVIVEVMLEIVTIGKSGGTVDKEWMDEVNRTGDTSVHSVLSKNVTVGLTWSYNASRVYRVLTVVEFGAVVEIAQGALTGQGSATFNLATSGNKATLASIVPP